MSADNAAAMHPVDMAPPSPPPTAETPQAPAVPVPAAQPETHAPTPRAGIRKIFRSPFADKEPKVVAPSSGGKTVRVADYINAPSTQLAVEKDGKHRAGVSPAEYANLSAETIDGIIGQADFHVRALIDLMHEETVPPVRGADGHILTKYEHMKSVQEASDLGYIDDKIMLGLFANPEGKSFSIKSPEEIKRIITEADSKTMMDLVQIEERWAQDVLAASGVRVEIQSPGHRPDIGNLTQSIDITDQGKIRVIGNRTSRFMTKPLNQDGRGDPSRFIQGDIVTASAAVVGGVGAAVLPGPLGFLAGATIGGSLGSVLGPIALDTIGRLTKGGVVLNIREDAEAGQNSANDPAESLRARYMLGIDNGELSSSKTLETYKIQAIKLVLQRAEFYTSLGVPPKNLDAFSDQQLYVKDRRPESIVYRRDLTVDRYYRDLVREHAPTTLAERRALLRRAQEKALEVRYKEEFDKEPPPGKGPSELLSEKRALRDAPGAREKRAKAASDEKTRLGTDKQTLEGSQSALKAYQDSLDALSKARTDLESNISQIILTNPAGATRTAANPREVSDLILLTLNNPTSGDLQIVLEDGTLKTIDNIAQRRRTARTNFNNALATASTMATTGPKDTTLADRQKSAREGAQEIYDQEKAIIDADAALIEAAKNRISTLQQTIKTNEDITLRPADTQTGLRLANEIMDSPTRLTGVTLPPGADFAAAMAAINATNGLNPAVGWPAERNDENRGLVRQILIANRAQTEMLGRLGAAFFTNFDAIANNPNPNRRISPDDLRTLTMEQLEARANTLYGVPANPAAIALRTTILNQAKEWANAQIGSTQRAIEEETRIISEAEKAEQRTIDNVAGTLNAEKAQLDLTSDIFDDTAGALKRARFSASSENPHPLLENANLATIDEGYTPAEVASGLPQNVLEILNILTNYQEDNGGDRGERFNEIITALGPNPNDRLERFLRASFDLPALILTAAPATPMEDFAIRLASEVNSRSVRQNNIQDNVGRLINQFLIWSRPL